MYLLPLIIIFVILCYFISYLVERKYERFVREHSLSIRTLKELNQRYVFHVISTFDLKHAYDNENFYSEIEYKKGYPIADFISKNLSTKILKYISLFLLFNNLKMVVLLVD